MSYLVVIEQTGNTAGAAVFHDEAAALSRAADLAIANTSHKDRDTVMEQLVKEGGVTEGDYDVLVLPASAGDPENDPGQLLFAQAWELVQVIVEVFDPEQTPRSMKDVRALLERHAANGIHSCHPECQRVACVARRERNAMRDRLRNLEVYAQSLCDSAQVALNDWRNGYNTNESAAEYHNTKEAIEELRNAIKANQTLT